MLKTFKSRAMFTFHCHLLFASCLLSFALHLWSDLDYCHRAQFLDTLSNRNATGIYLDMLGRDSDAMVGKNHIP